MDDAISGLLLGLGLSLLGVGVFFAVKTRRLLRGGVTVQGTIVDFDAASGGSGVTTYSPIVEYQTADGETLRYRSKRTRSRKELKGTRGAQVPVTYDPAEPSRAMLPEGGEGMSMSLSVIVVGLAVAGAGAGALAGAYDLPI